MGLRHLSVGGQVVLALGVLLVIFASQRPVTGEPPAGKVLRIGVLYAFNHALDPVSSALDRAMIDGLRAKGYEPGRNFTL